MTRLITWNEKEYIMNLISTFTNTKTTDEWLWKKREKSKARKQLKQSAWVSVDQKALQSGRNRWRTIFWNWKMAQSHWNSTRSCASNTDKSHRVLWLKTSEISAICPKAKLQKPAPPKRRPKIDQGLWNQQTSPTTQQKWWSKSFSVQEAQAMKTKVDRKLNSMLMVPSEQFSPSMMETKLLQLATEAGSSNRNGVWCGITSIPTSKGDRSGTLVTSRKLMISSLGQ